MLDVLHDWCGCFPLSVAVVLCVWTLCLLMCVVVAWSWCLGVVVVSLSGLVCGIDGRGVCLVCGVCGVVWWCGGKTIISNDTRNKDAGS